MYGLWLYKEFATKYGKCRLEIHQKDYSGQSEEIEAFAEDSLAISLENLGEIISPLGKSVCSFGIINTGQFDYDILFTPDATKFMIVVKTMVNEGEWVTRWSGFLTPDFFAEDLQYRSIISLSARDGIGQLNDIDFTYDSPLLTIQTLIQTAFSKVSPEYPMDVVIDTKKVIDGYTLDSAYIAADLFKVKSWGEAVETVLHDCGLQMRWVDNNTIKVYDISEMPNQFETQEVFFIRNSGYREILPAWKTLTQKQDYINRGNLYDAKVNPDLMVLDHSDLAYYPSAGGSPFQERVDYYKLLSDWSTAWDSYTSKSTNGSTGGIYVSAAWDSTLREQNYVFYKRNIQSSNYPVSIKLKTSKTIHYCQSPSYLPENIIPYNVYNAADPENTGYVQLALYVSVLLHADNGTTYYLGDTWTEYSGTSGGLCVKKFVLNKATYGDIEAEDIEILMQNVPYGGQLSIRIHGYRMEDFSYKRVNDSYPYPDWNAFFAYIDDVVIEIDTEQMPSSVKAGVLINEAHNIKRDEAYTLGTLPYGLGGETLAINGLYDNRGYSLYNVILGANEQAYTLIELVGREQIHFNLKNYEKLSGTIKAKAYDPLYFNRAYTYSGKVFVPYSYSLSLISNTMDITAMQEVVPYEVQNFADIQSAISTDGATSMVGGDNLALQYSGEVGNAKRIYELDTATEQDYEGSYIVIDKPEINEAKKVSVKDIVGQSQWFEERTTPSGKKYLHTNMTIASAGDVVSGAEGDIDVPEGEGGGGLKFAEERTIIPSQLIIKMLGLTLGEEVLELTDEQRQYNIETFNLTEGETPIILSAGGMWLYYYSTSYTNDVIQCVSYCNSVNDPETGLQALTVKIYPNGDAIATAEYQSIGLAFSEERTVVPTKVDDLGYIQELEIEDIARAYNIETLNKAFAQNPAVVINIEGVFLSCNDMITENGVRKAHFRGVQVGTSGSRNIVSVELIENGDAILKIEYDPYMAYMEELNDKLNDVIERLNKAGI